MGWSVLLAAEAVQAVQAAEAVEAVEAVQAAEGAEAVEGAEAAGLDQASLLGCGPQKWLRLERAKSPAGETEETSPWSLPA